MAAIEAVEFIRKDHGEDPGQGFRKDFWMDLPYRSILQRQEKTLPEVLDIFDWHPDDSEWVAEYSKPEPENRKLIRFKRRVYWDITGWREFNEDFGRGDVSCLRDIRTPLVTSRTPMMEARDEFIR